MMLGLTAQQAKYLRFIRGYQLAHGGTSPSISEICKGVDTRSRGTAAYNVKQLEVFGFIRRLPNRNRAIEIVKIPSVPSFAGVPLYSVPYHEGPFA
ncbi:hypothetical protein KFK14_11480 [Sphingobium phenoxybenzoativorans]|uniref:LexA repressor DNA-binding domain-containing protein n=1 Tax=Sphingobium phenoxybenzoativorans TaxID=1592790 RepID=A0A975KAS7_9SPHN|nr:hypothetical protein [Sphingobium phenoxybenzoativorans]QUT07950.1 hypothetical protein KFK14_11480 [Sphingobium phenoxybenzoativorans]